MSTNDVLRTFRADELRLFVAAASIALGLVIVGFAFVRQRFDRLLSFLAWFAIVYGFRLWLQSGMHRLMAPDSAVAHRLQIGLNFFVAVPAFLFFGEAGAVDRAGRVVVNAVCLIAMCLVFAAFLGVPWPPLDQINSSVVIVGSASMMFFAFRQVPGTRDELVFRAGLFVFVGLVLWTNVSDMLGHPARFEFYGFAVLLCSLGYVAARRTLDRDRQLNMLQQELEIARRIQMSILPVGSPNSECFCVATRYEPMTSVAGDFYEFLQDADGRLGLLVADVSGHGVPAALIASMVKVAVKMQRHRQDDPAALLSGVNQALCGNAQNQFVTAAYAYLDAERGELRYAAAGHPPMLLLRDGEVRQIEENGLVMALMSSAAYTFTTQRIERGDRILLYTDGILEAANASDEEFGYERLSRLLAQGGMQTPEQAVDAILAAVTTWATSQQDDLTLVICDYTGSGAKRGEVLSAG